MNLLNQGDISAWLDGQNTNLAWRKMFDVARQMTKPADPVTEEAEAEEEKHADSEFLRGIQFSMEEFERKADQVTRVILETPEKTKSN